MEKSIVKHRQFAALISKKYCVLLFLGKLFVFFLNCTVTLKIGVGRLLMPINCEWAAMFPGSSFPCMKSALYVLLIPGEEILWILKAYCVTVVNRLSKIWWGNSILLLSIIIIRFLILHSICLCIIYFHFFYLLSFLDISGVSSSIHHVWGPEEE
jgi:hypothetical protein